MRTKSEIEVEIAQAYAEKQRVCAEATAEQEARIRALAHERSLAIEQEGREREEYLLKHLPAFERILALAMRINALSKYNVWIDFAGHVDWMTVRGGLKYGQYGSPELFNMRIQLYQKKWWDDEDDGAVDRRLAEVEADLIALHQGADIDDQGRVIRDRAPKQETA